MISYDFAHTIQEIFNQVRNSNMTKSSDGHFWYPDNDFVKNPDVALYMTLEVCADNHGYEADGNTHRPEWVRHFYKELHFIITSRYNVFLAVSDKRFSRATDIKLEEWVNTSNHDSCWRTDGVEGHITKMMFDAWDHCFSHMPEEHQKKGSRSDGVRIRLMDTAGQVVRFVRVKHEPKDPKDSYRRVLTEIKHLVPIITFKDE